MEGVANGFVADALLAFIIKHDIVEDALKFFNELIETYKNKCPFFRLRKMENRPKYHQYLLSYLNTAGIIERYSNNGCWKIVDYETLKRLYLALQKCYVDDKEKEKMKMKYSGDVLYNGMQGIMYSIAKMIAVKENCATLDVVTSILIAYYIENYGRDEFIEGILQKLNTLKKVVEIESKMEENIMKGGD